MMETIRLDCSTQQNEGASVVSYSYIIYFIESL
jgi:hypothetical protein